MRFPSLQQLVSDARRALERFPFALLSAGLAAAGAWLAVSEVGSDGLQLKLALAGLLGLPLFIAITLWAERAGWSRGRSAALQLLAAVALTAYTLTLPDWWSPVASRRHVQLSVAFHLLVAVAPFVGRDEPGGFWEYNKTLFIRILTAAIYSVVLGVGLSIALLALDQLLGINVPDESYARLWIIIWFIFNTWFFLGGIPKDVSTLNDRVVYPIGLKVFAQYILVPIVTVYIFILTVYLVKIIATRVWPSGWIGYLVSSVSVLGILSLLLVYPIQDRAENKWIRTYGRWFYIALLPSIGMLLLAIWKRVAQYGITENRYFLIILALWLAAIALFFILTRSRKIKVIPASLCLVALATSFGPWGAYAVAERSQTGRLADLLTRNGMLVDGRTLRATSDPGFDDRKEMSAVLDYLLHTHGTASIAGWFGGELVGIDTVSNGEPSPPTESAEISKATLAHLGVDYVDRWTAEAPERFSFFLVQDAYVLPIAGFEYAFKADRHSSRIVALDGANYVVAFDTIDAALVLRRGNEERVIALPLAEMLERARQYPREGGSTRVEDPQLLMVEAENERARMRAYFHALTGRLEDGRPRVESLDATVYVTLRQSED